MVCFCCCENVPCYVSVICCVCVCVFFVCFRFMCTVCFHLLLHRTFILYMYSCCGCACDAFFSFLYRIVSYCVCVDVCLSHIYIYIYMERMLVCSFCLCVYIISSFVIRSTEFSWIGFGSECISSSSSSSPYSPGGRGIFDLTKITWTIEPIGFVPWLKAAGSVVPRERAIGPVVPAIVATVTDPSIPSKAPVPFLEVTI